MKKTLLTMATALLSVAGVYAVELTPEEALGRLDSSSRSKAIGLKPASPKLLHTFRASDNQPMIYVFGEDENYFLLSADDVALPLLGYADHPFDINNMPPQMKWWLSEYEEQIRMAKGKKAAPSSDIIGIDSSWGAIEPMVKTKWDQSAPYNDLCPVSNGQKCYTGCVATAVSQVMNYWKYPEHGVGEIKYKSDRLNRLLAIDLEENIFEWDKMLDTYEVGHYTEQEGNAVAVLMKCVGYSVKMAYSPSASGAMSYEIPYALKTYFNYDANCRLESRIFYSVSEWNALIYDNLKNVGPIIYNGDSLDEGGHSFICDGYDGKGYFHFNWGWGGMSDGYYVLSALDPNALGIGGGGGGFNFRQDAVLGMKPSNGQPVEKQPVGLIQNGSLEAEVNGLAVSFSQTGPTYPFWLSYNYEPVQMQFGAIAEPIDGTPGEKSYFTSSMNIVDINEYGSGIYQKAPSGTILSPSIKLRGLADGRYKLIIATQNILEENPEWVPVKAYYGNYNYVILNKKDGEYTIENLTPGQLTLSGASIDSELYAGCLVQISVDVANNTDFQMYKGLEPIIVIDDETAYVGKNSVVVMNPKSSQKLNIITTFSQLQGAPAIKRPTAVTLKFMDPESYYIYPEVSLEATMKANPGNPSMSMQSISLDAPQEGMYYQIADKNNIKFNTSIRVTRGYFAYPLYAAITDDAGNVLYRQRIGDEATFMNAGDTYEYSDILNFVTGESGVSYQLNITYLKNYTLNAIGVPARFTITDGSGVAEIASEEGITIKSDKANG